MARDDSNNDGGKRKTGNVARRSSKRTRSWSRETEEMTTTASSPEDSTDNNHKQSEQQQQHDLQPQQQLLRSNDDRDQDDHEEKRAKTSNSTSDANEGNSLMDTSDNNSMDVVDSENVSLPRPRLSWSDALKEGDIIEVTRILDEVATLTDTASSEVDAVPVDVDGFLEQDLISDTGPCTPLTLVCCYGHIEIAQLLLSHGADIELRNEDGPTAAHGATTFGHTDCLRLLLDKGAKVDAVNSTGDTALALAAEHGHVECLRFLLDKGSNGDGAMGLTIAAKHGQIECMKMLLANGVGVDSTDSRNRTALMIASQRGHLTSASFLLDNGATVDQTSTLNWASKHGRVDLVRLLLDKGAEVDPHNTQLDTPLIEAVRWGQPTCMQILCEQGANIDVVRNHCSPVRIASSLGRHSCLDYLIKAGADVKGALTIAARQDHIACVRLLYERSVEPEEVALAIQGLMRYGDSRINVLRFFLAKGHVPNLNAATRKKLFLKHPQTVILLVSHGVKMPRQCPVATPDHVQEMLMIPSDEERAIKAWEMDAEGRMEFEQCEEML